MFLAVRKNGENKKTLGLLSQSDQCGRRREFAEDSGDGTNASGEADEPNVRQARGRMASPHQAARGRIY